jgi:hypothetical protein
VIGVLRFIGVTNAAIWLGAAVFFTFGAAPVFFTEEIRRLLNGPFWPGVIAQMAVERYFHLQYVCSVIALIHQAAEWLYLGRTLRKVTLALLCALMFFSFVGGLWLVPNLKRLYLVKNGVTERFQPAAFSPDQRARAARQFGTWHGLARVLDLFVLGGLVVYLWRVTHPEDSTRFVSATKFRS